MLGLAAAAPVLAHALDWRKHLEAKQKLKDERALKLRQQIGTVREIAPTADDVYKAAAFIRTLEFIPKSSVTARLDLIDQVLKPRK